MSQNQEAATAASSKELPNGVRVDDAEEVHASPDRLEAEQHPPTADGSDLKGVADPKSDGGDDKYMQVNLNDIRKNVECPICLGIIKKCHTIMECMHRFCKECIEKTMQTGRNKCPVCHIHCPILPSLVKDTTMDAVISVLFPNIEAFEEQEMPFRDEERIRNEQVTAAIAEIARRQSEAMSKRRRLT